MHNRRKCLLHDREGVGGKEGRQWRIVLLQALQRRRNWRILRNGHIKFWYFFLPFLSNQGTENFGICLQVHKPSYFQSKKRSCSPVLLDHEDNKYSWWIEIWCHHKVWWKVQDGFSQRVPERNRVWKEGKWTDLHAEEQSSGRLFGGLRFPFVLSGNSMQTVLNLIITYLYNLTKTISIISCTSSPIEQNIRPLRHHTLAIMNLLHVTVIKIVPFPCTWVPKSLISLLAVSCVVSPPCWSKMIWDSEQIIQ